MDFAAGNRVAIATGGGRKIEQKTRKKEKEKGDVNGNAGRGVQREARCVCAPVESKAGPIALFVAIGAGVEGQKPDVL